MYRTHTCGCLRAENVNQTVTLAGWVQKVRNLGAMTFIDLRDRYGITQVVIEEHSPAEARQTACCVGREWVIQVVGKVIERQSKNPRMATGDIEVAAQKVTILHEAEVPPFTIEEVSDGGDDLRMKYRYLDLRRPPLQRNMILRHKMAQEIRRFLRGADSPSGEHQRQEGMHLPLFGQQGRPLLVQVRQYPLLETHAPPRPFPAGDATDSAAYCIILAFFCRIFNSRLERSAFFGYNGGNAKKERDIMPDTCLEDFDYLAQTLREIHPAYAEDARPLEEAAAVLKRQWLGREDIRITLGRLAALPGDGHTNLEIPCRPDTPCLPAPVRWFGGKLHIFRDCGPLRQGDRLTAVCGLPLSAYLERLKSWLSHENAPLLLGRTTCYPQENHFLFSLLNLQAVFGSLAAYELEGERQGERFTVRLSPEPFAALSDAFDNPGFTGGSYIHTRIASDSALFCLDANRDGPEYQQALNQMMNVGRSYQNTAYGRGFNSTEDAFCKALQCYCCLDMCTPDC